MERSTGPRDGIVLCIVAAVVLSAVAPVGVVAATAGGGPAAAGAAAQSTTGAADGASDLQPTPAPIQPSLERANGTVEVVVRLEDASVSAASSEVEATSTLQSTAERTQRRVVEFARDRTGVAVRDRFWITNAMVLTVDTERVRLERIARIPNVEALHENFAVRPMDPAERSAAAHTAGDRQRSTENVDADHPAINDSFAGFAQFDETGARDENVTPYDSGYHGTHVSGTVVEDDVDLLQGGHIRGTVTNESGAPIAGATVTLDTGRTVETNATGHYELSVSNGTYEVTVDGFGYYEETSQATVDGGTTTNDVTLSSIVEARVTTSPPPRIESGNAITVTLETRNLKRVSVSATGVNDSNATLYVNGETVAFGTETNVSDPDGTLNVTVVPDRAVETNVTLAYTVVGNSSVERFSTQETWVLADAVHLSVVDTSTGTSGAETVRLLRDRLPSRYVVTEVTTAEALAASDHFDVFVVQKFAQNNTAVREFVAATATNETGVVYLDNHGSDATGVERLSAATGRPSTTNEALFGDVEYTIQRPHPIVDDARQSGTTVDLYYGYSGIRSWFDGGDWTVLATVGADGSTDGAGLAVDERNRTVLAASLGRTAGYDNDDFSTVANDLVENAVRWVTPGPPPNITVVTETSNDEVNRSRGRIPVSLTLANDGRFGSKNVSMFVNGTVVDSTSVPVYRNDTGSASLSHTFDRRGTYLVNTTGTELTIVNVGGVHVENVSVPAANESAGVDLSLTLDNDAPSEQTRTLRVRVGGDPVENRTVTLGSGENVTLTPTVDAEAGPRNLSVEWTDAPNGTRTATAVTVAGATVVDGGPNRTLVDPWEYVTVNATVRGYGDGNATETVPVITDGVETTNRTVTVAGGETRTVTLTRLSISSPGTTEIRVGNLSPTTVTVEGATVDDVSLNRTTVDTNQSVRVNATVAAYGSGNHSVAVPVGVDGTEVANETVRLPAGETRTLTVTNLSFPEYGLYRVTVGGTAIYTVTVEDLTPPTARLSANASTVEVGDGVTLNASATTDNAGVAYYEWDVGADGTVDYNTTDPTLALSDLSLGTVNASVRAVDASGNADVANATVTAEDTTDPTPVVVVNATTVEPGGAVAFDGRNSTDETGIVEYIWEFDGDVVIDETGPTAVHRFEDLGTYNASLVVRDAGDNVAIQYVTITVESESDDGGSDDGGNDDGSGDDGGGGSVGGGGGGGQSDPALEATRSGPNAVDLRGTNLDPPLSVRTSLPETDAEASTNASFEAIELRPASEAQISATATTQTTAPGEAPILANDYREPLAFLEVVRPTGELESATLTVTVDADVVDDTGNVEVYRYRSGALSWSALDARYVGETDGTFEYEVVIEDPSRNEVYAVVTQSPDLRVVEGTVDASGDRLTGEVTLENVGEGVARERVPVTVGDAVVDRRLVLVEPGENATIEFDAAVPDPGEYEVAAADEQFDTVTVQQERTTTPPTTTRRTTAPPTTATSPPTTTATRTAGPATSTGERPTATTATDEQSTATTGGTTTADQPPAATGTTPSDSGSDGSVPGFGIPALLAALGLIALVRGRRHSGE